MLDLCRRPLDDKKLVNLGHSETICPNSPPEIVVDLRARCVVGESLAVVFSVVSDDDPCCQPDDVFVLVRGHLSWGLGCASFDASLDLLNGTILSLPAETISVSAEMIVIPRIGTDPCDVCPPQPVRVSAGFAYSYGGKHPSRFTEIVQIANPGERQRIAIPNFAMSFSLVPVGTGSLQAEVLTFGPGASPQYLASGPITNNGQSAFPLVGGARCIEIVNLGVGPLMAFVLFGLDL